MFEDDDDLIDDQDGEEINEEDELEEG